jgi:DNA adenine methylase
MNDVLLAQKVRPVLKWAGGKSRLLPDLLGRLPDSFDAYHEPFLGGGALFFELANQRRLTKAYISDVNQALIDVYQALRDCVGEVIYLLKIHRSRHGETHYYRVRTWTPGQLTLAERAARVIYLNRTCYNGLYRENQSGEFNVPFGRYKNPLICDEPNLRAVSHVLRDVDISCGPFSSVLKTAKAGDLVYFDPPYSPVSSTSNFTSYHRDGFGAKDQADLRCVFVELANRGVNVLLSNSDVPFIRQLYDGYEISRVFAARAINCQGHSRGKIAEVIVYNERTH